MKGMSGDYTVYHEAAESGCLNQAPLHLLTDAVLSMPCPADGDTVLTKAICAKTESPEYDAFVGHLLTAENLLVEDKCGKNIMELAVEKGVVDRIPTTLVVPDSYQKYLDVPHSKYAGRTWWDVHKEHCMAKASLTAIDDSPEIALF